MISFALLMLVAATSVLSLEQMWQNSALDIDGILTDGTFQEVKVSSELSCVLMAAHKFKNKDVCYQKPRCVIPSGTAEKSDTASTEWTCKESEVLSETNEGNLDDPFITLDDVGCILIDGNSHKTYNDAVTDCAEKGASLAVVEDYQAFQKLSDYLKTIPGNNFFIGIQKAADSAWRWRSPQMAVALTFWGDSEPSANTNSCAVMNIDKGFKLAVGDCNASHQYICLK